MGNLFSSIWSQGPQGPTTPDGNDVVYPPELCGCKEICKVGISINMNQTQTERVRAQDSGGTTGGGLTRTIKFGLHIDKVQECYKPTTEEDFDPPKAKKCFNENTTNSSGPQNFGNAYLRPPLTCNIRSDTELITVLGITDTGHCSDIPDCDVTDRKTCESSTPICHCFEECTLSVKYKRSGPSTAYPFEPVGFKKDCCGKNSGWQKTAADAGFDSTDNYVQSAVLDMSNSRYWDGDDATNHQFPGTVPHGNTFGNDFAISLVRGDNPASKAVCKKLKKIAECCEAPCDELCCDC